MDDAVDTPGLFAVIQSYAV